MTKLLPLLVLGLSCSATHRADREARRDERKQAREDARLTADLSDRADRCWRARRWADLELASACLERSEDRVAFHDWLEDQADKDRLTEATVLHVELIPADVGIAEGHLREATVTVHVEGYEMPEQVLYTDTILQSWYLVPDGWFAEWP